MLKTLTKLFERDLDRLASEVAAFPETQLWALGGTVRNSAGNLALHLTGNLQHFIGAQLGKTGYVRDRAFEFSGKVTQAALLAEIETAKAAVSQALSAMEDKALEDAYPMEVFGHEMTTGYFLVHLQGHLNYHLGQINYLRQLLPSE